MKTKTLVILALTVLGCLSALAANALGVDVQAFAQSHQELLSGLSMLGFVGNIDYVAEVTKSIQAQENSLLAQEAAFTTMKNDLATRIEHLENSQAKSKRPGFGGNSRGFEAGEMTQESKAFKKFMTYGDDTELKSLAISTNAGADGGYAVPKVIDSMIESLVVNISPMRQVANVVQISTNDYHKLVNLKGSASAVAAELGARPATTTPTLADVVINPYDIYANPQASQQMLDDVFFNAEQWLAEELSEEFGRQEGALFINGTGTAQPRGILGGAAPVATADNLRTFGTLQYLPTGVAGAFPASNPADYLLAMVYSLKAAYRANAHWMMPKAVLQTISQFKDSSGRYILTPITQPGIPATLFGFPIVEAEDFPGVAANSLSIAFGDFKRAYQIVDRMGIRVIRDPFSNRPYVGFYTTKRVGGSVVNSEAVRVGKFSVS